MGKGEEVQVEPVLISAQDARAIRADLLGTASRLLETEVSLLEAASQMTAASLSLLEAADGVRAAALSLIHMGKGLP
jgi:hypothetical protein